MESILHLINCVSFHPGCKMSDYDRDRRSGSRDKPVYGGPLPTRSMMGSRIYVGKLPSDVREREVEKSFGKYGKIREIAMKGNYCFIVSVFIRVWLQILLLILSKFKRVNKESLWF